MIKTYSKVLILLVYSALSFTVAYSQSASTFSASYNNEELGVILDDLSKKGNVNIIFEPEWVDGFRYSGVFDKVDFGKAFRTVLAGKGITFLSHKGSYYIVRSKSISYDIARYVGINLTDQELEKREEEVQEELIKQYARLTYYMVRGEVTDTQGSPIRGIIIKDEVSGETTVTDASGKFQLKLNVGKHRLVFNGLGFENSFREIVLSSDETLKVQMFDESLMLDELVVSVNDIDEGVNNIQSSVELMKIETIKELPTFLGEVDVIQNILALPGVTTVGEGAGGFNVRGGNTDENLILMDGMPIFNSSHLFGFFSVFNSDVIDQFALYKGGIPARFGGRTSSILDVQTKKGDLEKFRLSGSIGLVSSKAKIEIPIIKDRASFMIGFRSAYPEWILNLFPDDDIKESTASFYDLNTKFLYKFKNNSELTINTYNSEDKFELAQDTLYNWNNFGFSTNYTKSFNEKNSLNINLVYSRFDNNIDGKLENNEFLYTTEIDYKSFSSTFIHTINADNIIEVGVQSNLYDLNSGEIKPTAAESSINDFKLDSEKALESALFGSYDKNITNKLTAQVGLRLSYYSNLGPGKVFNYSNPENPTVRSVTDSTLYGNEFYGGVLGLEPRANLKFQIDNNSSIKMGYNLMRQNIHQISITSAIAPGDYWKLSDPNIAPTIANQVNIGYYKLMGDYALTVESYYKKITNLLDYKDGASIFLNPKIETAIINAAGRSYGFELKLEKQGRLSGWVSYTLSKSERRSLINESTKKFIPTNYDKPHNFSATANYKLNRRLSIAGNFIVSSGRPITVPQSGYFYNDQLIVNYSERNSSRIPTYHRLDVSIVLKGNLKKDKTYKGRWVFSIYNVYGRRNPFSVYFDTVARGLIPQGYKLSILGSAFPSLSYSFRIQ